MNAQTTREKEEERKGKGALSALKASLEGRRRGDFKREERNIRKSM